MLKIIASAVAMILVSFCANAANQGQGAINFKGTVINAPCGIAPESADQSIDFGQISKAHLNNNGQSIQKPVDIKLVNCDFSDGSAPNKTVEVQFTGTTEAGGAATNLGLSRTNAIIRMAAQDGTLVAFDGSNKTNATKLMDGDNTLHYQAWVQKGTKNVEEGEFSAVAQFNLSYQ
ncbi:F7-2 fimbrial protein [Escherichia coli]|uniref:fimbrial protein n=1 Tax=Escherichia coli TaxID=562 RepID=UPI000542526B|nr:fimbrial protein [Escherichia coli]KHH53307.1 F7-2 fimbrial protein [Escherichia coli]